MSQRSVFSFLKSLWHSILCQAPADRGSAPGLQNEDSTRIQEKRQSYAPPAVAVAAASTPQSDGETAGQLTTEAAITASTPVSEHQQTPGGEGEACLDPFSLCSYCSTISLSSLTSPSGHPFHPTWSALRRSADTGRGCPLCVFLADWTMGIKADDGTLIPYGLFNGVFRVSDAVMERLSGLEDGRLCVLEIFEGAGKGLLGKLGKEGDLVWFYMGLGLGEENSERISQRYGISIRRPLTSTSSPSSIETARRWLAACDAEHDCCQAMPSTATRFQSPASRLLDLWALGRHCNDMKLVETWKERDTSHYTALSHRWGSTSMPFTTTRATFLQRTERISFNSLPLTFRHAVQVTRELGLRYLWIDSLCIIQDDAEDWAVESGRMGSIYAHSYVTIAADSSASSEGGLFNSKSVLQDEEPLGRHVVLNAPVEESGERRCSLYLSDERAVPSNLEIQRRFEGDDDPDDEGSSDRMLVTRGWTLQEAVLAPRVLHFTSKQLIWECPWKGYTAEDIFSVNLRYIRPTFTEMKNHLRLKAPDDGQHGADSLRNRRLDVLKAWYIELIELHYATRDLTFLKDKLPAIAGLAAWTAPALDCEYIAGMWRTELVWAMTWFTHKTQVIPNRIEGRYASAAEDSKSSKLQAHEQSQAYRSPSFSWACSVGQVSWQYALETFQPTAEVESVHTELECSSLTFGRVAEGCWIRIAGFLSRHVVTPSSGSWNAFVFHRCNGISGKIRMDRTFGPRDAEDGASSCEITCFELGLGSGPELQTGKQLLKTPRWISLLVLAPIGGRPGCYTRQGIADWEWAEEGEACKSYTELREWRTVTIY